MTTIPKFDFFPRFQLRNRGRSLQLKDCAPGDTVCLPGKVGFYIVSRTVNSADSVVRVSTESASYERLPHDTPVVRIRGRSVFEPNLSATVPYLPNVRATVGSLVTTKHGTVLIAKYGREDHNNDMQLNLDSFVVSEATQRSSGLQFTSWCLKLVVDNGRSIDLVKR